MSSYGLFTEGLVLPLREDLVRAISNRLIEAFGDEFDVSAESPAGQHVEIVADYILEVWRALEGVATSVDPDQASGERLDAGLSIGGVRRLAAAPTRGTLREIVLNAGVTLPVGRQVRVGSSGPILETTEEVTNGTSIRTTVPVSVQAVEDGPQAINAGVVDSIVTAVSGWLAQAILVSQTTQPFVLANGQSFTISVDGGPAQTVTFLTADFVSIGAATAAEVVAKINSATTGLTATVNASGGFDILSDTVGPGSSLSITPGGAAANPLGLQQYIKRGFNPNEPPILTSPSAQPYALSNGQTLSFLVGGVLRTVTFLTADFVSIGAATAVEVANKIRTSLLGCTAYVSGQTRFTVQTHEVGAASTLAFSGGTAAAAFGFTDTTPVSGRDGALVTGRDDELDSEARVRRVRLLSTPGAASLGALIAAVGRVDGVLDVTGQQNVTDATDSSGLPPHSVEIIARGGSDEDVAAAIAASLEPGTATHRDPGPQGRTVALVDSEGVSYSINFSRQTDVPIYTAVTVQVAPNVFGGGTQVNGIAEVQNAIVAEGAKLNVGDDVVALRQRCAPLTVPGVLDVTVLNQGTSPSPVTGPNITITSRQRASFIAANVVVTVIT